MDYSMTECSVVYCLPEFAKLMTIESVMLSNHMILYHPPAPFAFNLSQHQGLFQ